MFKTFRGGIRFDSIASEAKKRDIMRLDDVPELFISLKQDSILCREQTEIGSYVRMYQPIAVPVEDYGVPVFSPVSGHVTAICENPHPLSGNVKVIVIKNDMKYVPYECETQDDPENMEPLDIIELAQRAAIPGPNLFSRPAYMRLLRMRHRETKTLVCNVAENEPYIGHATRLSIEHTAQVIRGLHIMMRSVGAAKGIIAVPSGAAELSSAVRRELRSCGEQYHIRMATVANKYPAHDRMSRMFEDMNMNIGEKPFAAGITTPFACFSLEQAVRTGIPVTRVPVSVCGPGINKEIVIDAPIGTPVRLLLQTAGLKEDIGAVVMGGAMTGVSLASTDDYSILRTSFSIIAFTETTEYSRTDDCIHCGRCAKVCPQNLTPSIISGYVSQGNIAAAKALGLDKCRLCGCCSYICPGRVELTDILEKGRRLSKK